MYSIDTEVRYKIYDIYSGNESYWLSNMDEVKKTLKEMIYRYVGRRPIHDNDLLSYIKFNFNEKKEARFIYSSELDFCYSSELGVYTYLYHRIFVIMDNYGRKLPPNKLPGVYYDYRMCQYRFKDSIELLPPIEVGDSRFIRAAEQCSVLHPSTRFVTLL